ncbi:MAG: hypothetical protein Q9183_007778, partial [Haloplaca sp. 2 TL-2023]
MSEHHDKEAHGRSSKRQRTNDSRQTDDSSDTHTPTLVASARSSTAHGPLASAAAKSSTGLKSKAGRSKFEHLPTARRHRPQRLVTSTETPQIPQVTTTACSNPHCQEALKCSLRNQSAELKPVSSKTKTEPQPLVVSSSSKTNMKSTNPSDVAADRFERSQSTETLIGDTVPTQHSTRTQSHPRASTNEHPKHGRRSEAAMDAKRAMDIKDRADEAQRRDRIQRLNRPRSNARDDQRSKAARKAQRATEIENREDKAQGRDSIRHPNRLRSNARDDKTFERHMQCPTTSNPDCKTRKQ